MKRFLPVLAAAALAVAAGSPAAATIIDYHLTGAVTASWQLDTSRAPDDVRYDLFGYWNVPITVDGVSYDSAAIYFFPEGDWGGVEADQYWDTAGDVSGTFFSAMQFLPPGGQLYAGSTSNPELLTGSWGQLSEFNNIPDITPVYQLTATFGAVPEPAAWLLMIVGVALTGPALRRRRSLVPAV